MMNKSTTLAFFTAFLWCMISSKAQVLTEDFEGTFPPTGWNQNYITNNNSWIANTGNSNGSVTTAHGGNQNALLVNFTTSPDVTRLVSPAMNLTGIFMPQLEFWHTQEEWAPDQDELRVYYRTSFGGNWTLLANYTSSIDTWTQEIINLPNPTATYYIAFEGTVKYGRGITIDDIVVAATTTCLEPTNLSVTTPTATTANVAWTENNGANNWEIEWGVLGFTQGTGTTISTSSNPHSLTGLVTNTDYSFYVRTLCGGGDNSAWAGPFAFRTPCTPIAAPWVESFNNPGLPNCWNQGLANAEDWRFNNSAGHVGNAGIMGNTSNSGGRFAWVDDSSPSNTATTLMSPLIDVSALTTPALSFYTISNNEGHSNVNFSVDVFDGTNWNVGFYTHNNNTYQGEWEEVLLNLSTLTITGNIQLRFIVDEVVSGDYYDDRAIDDIRIDELPTCPKPVLLAATNFTGTTADVNWVENGTATLWEIEYGPTGFVLGTGTNTTTTSNPYTITGLNSMSSYDICIRSICGTASAWTCHTFQVPLVFTSSNLPIVVINTNGQTILDDIRIVADMGIIHNAPLRNNVSDPFNNYNGRISIELRGSSSQSFPKKSYSFETQDILGGNNNVSLVDLPIENDWVLYAPYSDKSLMRNPLTYHFGNLLMDYAPRTRMCEVMLNGEYIGVYVLTEKIKQDKNRVDIADLTINDVNGDSLSGGYILKIDKTTGGSSYDFFSNYLPNNASGGQQIGYQIHYPKPDTILPVQVAYINAYIDSFENALQGPNFADSTLGFPNFADGLSFIDFFIMNEITRNVDGYRISTYLFKDKASNGGKLKMGPLWDFNIALGNADYCDGGTTTGWAKDFNVGCGNHGQLIPFWWDRLEQDPAYVTLRKCRWDYLRQNALHTDSLMAYIDTMVVYLNESQQRNFSQWPTLGNYIWPNNYIGATYQDEVNYLKTWLTDRMIWIDNNLPGSASNCSVLLNNRPIQAANVAKKEVLIYPNPASTRLYVEGFVFEQLIMYNQLGQVVLDKRARSTSIYDKTEVDVSKLQTGIYVVELKGALESVTKKVVVE